MPATRPLVVLALPANGPAMTAVPPEVAAELQDLIEAGVRDGQQMAEAVAPWIAAAERAEAERWKLNARRMALLAEAFVYEPRRITEGGLMAQVHRVLTDQDVDWPDGAP